MRHPKQRPRMGDARTLFFQPIKIATTGTFVIRREDNKAFMNERELAYFETTKALALTVSQETAKSQIVQHSVSNLHLR